MTLDDTARNASVNGVMNLLDGGDIVLKNAGSSIIVTINLPATIPDAATGTADMTAGGSLTGTPASNDTVTQGALRTSAAAERATFSVSDTAGTGELKLDDGVNDGGGAAVTTNDTVSVNTLNYTQPAS